MHTGGETTPQELKWSKADIITQDDVEPVMFTQSKDNKLFYRQKRRKNKAQQVKR
ncbi:hypothetical protein KHA80_18520 [Anaerobacillus sp. HL2]|nr:hypothetical protein KHA80_18520 [Anaerobacillus sp. HL2]